MKEALRKFLEFISNEKVIIDGVALIGGIALGGWITPRATRDMDFLINLKKNNAESIKKLAEKLEENGWEVITRKGDFKDHIKTSFLLKDKSGENIDLIIVGYKWEEEIIREAKILRMFGDIETAVAGPEGLIVLKLKAGGPQDIVDAGNLLLHTLVERVKLNKLSKRAGINKNLEKLKKELGIT